MGIRDQEIQKLQSYAEGLGLQVQWRKHRRGDPGAAWITDGSVLIMYTWPGKSKKRIVLDFLHELAHHMAWVYNNRQEDSATDEALDKESSRKPGDPPIDKTYRKLIYVAERDDAEYRNAIAHEVGIKLDKKVLELDKKLDIAIYLYYYRTGEMPTQSFIERKKNKLKKEVYES